MAEETKTNIVYTASGCLSLLPDLHVMEKGSGWCANAGLIPINERDGGIALALSTGVADMNTLGRLFPETEPSVAGTYTQNSMRLFGFELGLFRRTRLSDDDGTIWLMKRNGDYNRLSIGRTKLATPDQTLGSGVKYEGSSDEWYSFNIESISEGGLEFLLSDGFYMMPFARISNTVPFYLTDKKKRQERPHSGRYLRIDFGFELGFGKLGDKIQKYERMTGPEVGVFWYQYLLQTISAIGVYENFQEPMEKSLQPVDEIFGGEDGGSSMLGGGYTWPLASYQTLSQFLDAQKSISPVSFYRRAPGDWGTPIALAEGIKGVGFMAAGGSGDRGSRALYTPGLTSLDNLLMMGASGLLKLDEDALPIAAFALSWPKVFIAGSVLSKDPENQLALALLDSSINGFAWMGTPEQGRTPFLSSSGWRYAPAGFALGRNGGVIGTYISRNSYRDFPLYTESEIGTPLITPGNVGSLLGNATRPPENESGFSNTGGSSYLRQTLGAELVAPLDKSLYTTLGIGGSLYNITDPNLRQRGAVGVSAGAGLGIMLGNSLAALTFNLDAHAYLALGGGGGGAIVPSIGLTTWRTNPLGF